MGPGLRRDDLSVCSLSAPAGRHVNVMRSYASPAVSNIEAAIASVADFPAQTTNWNAG